MSSSLVFQVKKGITKAYNAEIAILQVKQLPSSAYYKPRRRYRADRLLNYLENQTDKKYFKVLGLTERDISTTKGKIYDWGIFGLASIGGRAAVVSTYRLRSGGVSRKKFIERLIKVVNHELGHTFGLYHCPSRFCIMGDAKGTIKTVDRETGRFCHECMKKLKNIVKTGDRKGSNVQ